MHAPELMPKMTSLYSYASSQTNLPRLHCALDNAVIKSSPLLHQSLSQMCSVTYTCFVHTLLQNAPDFVVHWIEIRAIWRPEQLWDKIWCFSLQQSHSLFRPVRWRTILLE